MFNGVFGSKSVSHKNILRHITCIFVPVERSWLSFNTFPIHTQQAVVNVIVGKHRL